MSINKNKYVTIDPDIVVVTEFVTFTQTFDINYSVPDDVTNEAVTYDYVFHDIPKNTSIPKWCDIKYERLADKKFKIFGTLNDVFDREIHYIDNNYKKQKATRFALIPSDYSGIFKYVGTIGNAQTFYTMNVRMRPIGTNPRTVSESLLHTYSIKLQVNANWQTAQQYFVKAVYSSDLAKHAAALDLI